MAAHSTVSTQTPYHSITIKDGELVIIGNEDKLAPEETLLLLEVLLIWWYGFETRTVDDVR